MDQSGPVVFQKNTYSESSRKTYLIFPKKVEIIWKKTEKTPSRLYLKSSKEQAQAASIWLDKKSFPKQKKMKRFHKENRFRLERNGTFFLLLRRFFKLPPFGVHTAWLQSNQYFFELRLWIKQKQNLQPQKRAETAGENYQTESKCSFSDSR